MNASLVKIVDYRFDIGRQILIFRRIDDEVALAIYAEIVGPPILDTVCLDGLLYD